MRVTFRFERKDKIFLDFRKPRQRRRATTTSEVHLKKIKFCALKRKLIIFITVDWKLLFDFAYSLAHETQQWRPRARVKEEIIKSLILPESFSSNRNCLLAFYSAKSLNKSIWMENNELKTLWWCFFARKISRLFSSHAFLVQTKRWF